MLRELLLVCVVGSVGAAVGAGVCPSVCSCQQEGALLITDCSELGLSSIPEDLNPLTSYLDLSMNNISEIQPNAFHSLPFLTELRLSGNQLRHISGSALRGLTGLKILMLQNNQLERLESEDPWELPNLLSLNFQDSGALPANLTSKSSSRLVLTQLPDVFPLERVPLSQLASSPWPHGLSSIRQPATTNGHGNPQIPNHILQSSHCHGTETCQFPSSFTSFPSVSSSSSVSQTHPLLSSTLPATQRPKLVPIFTNKSLSRHVNVTKILAEKKQQKQDEAQCASRAAVKRPSCSPLSSASSVPRVSLPFFKDRKRDHNVCDTTPAHPLFQAQSAPMTEIKREGEVFESQPKKAKVNIQEVDVVKYARSNQLAKINAATLQAWLKGQRITVRSKDKKEDLMSKVMQCLSEP